MIRSVLRISLLALATCALAALAAAALPQASRAASPGPPAVGGLVSPNHPVASAWYANSNPLFSWRGELATPALAGYAYVLDQSPTTLPAAVVDLVPLSFAPEVLGPLSVSGPVALFAGDFNGDGKADLVAPDSNRGTITIRLSEGNGRFGAPHSTREGLGRRLSAIADLNHDGKLDLVTGALVGARERGTIGVQLGRGNGTFRPRRDYLLGFFDSASMGPVVVGDVNGDHKRDIVTSVGTRLIVLPGRGNGTFGPEQVSLGQASDADGDLGFIHGLALGDVNGDGRVDVVAAGQDGANTPVGILSVGLGSGNGRFKTPVTTMSGDFVPGSVALADLNHDGHKDLLVQYGVDLLDYAGSPDYSAVVLSLSTGHGAFTKAAEYDFTPQQSPSFFQLADFNGDGNPDLGFVTGTGIDVVLGNGDASFQPGLRFGQTSAGVAVAGDFNGDGKPDIAFAPASGATVATFLNRSNQAA